MDIVVRKSIQWEKMNVWCCGMFFSFGNIEKHREEAHPQNSGLVQQSKSCHAPTKAKAEDKDMNGDSDFVISKNLKKEQNHVLKLHEIDRSIVSHLEPQHSKDVHRVKDIKIFSCEYCGKSYRSLKSLNYHIAVHSEDMNFNCSYCTKKFKRKQEAKECEIKHSGIFKHSCHMCEFKTNKKWSLDSHISSHLKLKNFPCPICGRKFSRKNNLKNHLLNIHEIDGSIISHLESQHIKDDHTGKDIKNFSCEYCGKSYRFKKSLTYHIAVHSKELDFKCSFCAKKFRRNQDAKQCENEHNGIFKYRCHMCEYKTSHKWSFQSHMNSHLKLKPFECFVCKKKLSRKFQVRKHLLKLHEINRSIISHLEAMYPQIYNASEKEKPWRNDQIFQNLIQSLINSKLKDSTSLEGS